MKKKMTFLFCHRKLNLIKDFLTLLGVFWLLIEVTSFFWEWFNEFSNKNLGLFIFILILTLLIAVKINFPKKEISREFKNLNNTIVKIEIGELLSKEGNIIIGSSDFFDTTTNNTTSIKRQIIDKFFNGAIQSLDSQIETSLNAQNIQGTQVSINEKPVGKRIRYDIGETANFSIPSNINIQVFISAICKIVYKGGVKTKEADIKMLTEALEKIWLTIRNNSNNKNIYIPILGAGITGLNMSKTTICQLIIVSFLINSKNNRIGKSLNIIIPERNYDPEMFSNLEIFIKSFSI
ncbi:hypothetical protein DRF59_06770 [Chryseobacterium flavum]|uniref:Thoeris protein ThsA Macro domain-containing protein n=1 Tax=Chryseobacterium flavum TaxID=415851 RepID=A0A3D9CQW9_9FLAO|nr:macro domain-containing protein [Chryseobacterium flavum]REC68007.1 hypothetical protein DRF59_06770 [Chryseobacterium flavum]